MKRQSSGFTIVELLVVVIVIGILAALVIVSYTGLSQRATTASMQSDLSVSTQQLKMFQVEKSTFPDTINCSIADSDTNKCIRPSTGSVFTYTVDNAATPQSFLLEVMNGRVCYETTDNTAPTLVACKWLSGLAGTNLAGKYVYYRDINSTDTYSNGSTIGTNTMRWKTSNTACVGPQCATGLDPTMMSNYSLVASNSVDFALSTNPPTYPARDACKVVGGRLPNGQELAAIYSGRSSYGNNFQTAYYWSATELISTAASRYYNGSPDFAMKDWNGGYVRCVKG